MQSFPGAHKVVVEAVEGNGVLLVAAPAIVTDRCALFRTKPLVQIRCISELSSGSNLLQEQKHLQCRSYKIFSDDSKHAKAEKDRIAYPVMDECERTVGVAQLNKLFYFCAITVDSFYRHNLV